MTFHVGEKVRCINGAFHDTFTGGPSVATHLPEQGKVYTVLALSPLKGSDFLSLEELSPTDYFEKTSFRKLPKTNISLFQQMLVPTKERVS